MTTPTHPVLVAALTVAQSQVREFMLKAGQDCPNSPHISNPCVNGLRIELIAEELAELKEAYADHNTVEVADAIGDLLVVVLGTAVANGIEIGPVFAEIHRSNMTKFIDGHRREDGKWIKGPSYSPANLKPILEAQERADKP